MNSGGTGRGSGDSRMKSPGSQKSFHPYGRGKGLNQRSQLKSPGQKPVMVVDVESDIHFLVDKRGSGVRAADDDVLIDESSGKRETRDVLIFIKDLNRSVMISKTNEELKSLVRGFHASSQKPLFAYNENRSCVRVEMKNGPDDDDPDELLSRPVVLSSHDSAVISNILYDMKKNNIFTCLSVDHTRIRCAAIIETDFRLQVAVIKSLLLDEESLKRRKDLMSYFSCVLTFYGMPCTIHAIGSTINGIGFKDADIDLFIYLSSTDPMKQSMSRDMAYAHLLTVRKALQKELKMRIDNPIHARCPIVKIDFASHKRLKNGIQCDLSLSNIMGTFNSEIIKHFGDSEPLFKDLAVLIKYWLKSYDMIGPNFITSYGCLLLVVFFMQSLRLLPSVQELQAGVPSELVEGRWNVNFSRDPKFFQVVNPSEKPKLSQLLLWFFNFYAKFGYRLMNICPFYGSAIPKEEVFRRDSLMPSQGISIQDLLQLDSNIGKNIFEYFSERLKKNFRVINGIISNMDRNPESDDDAARKVYTEMLESLDEDSVQGLYDKFKFKTYQTAKCSSLTLPQMTPDTLIKLVDEWSQTFPVLFEMVMTDILKLTVVRLDEYKTPPRRQGPIAKFNVEVNPKYKNMWKARVPVRNQLESCLTHGKDFMEIEMLVSSRILKVIEALDENQSNATSAKIDGPVQPNVADMEDKAPGNSGELEKQETPDGVSEKMEEAVDDVLIDLSTFVTFSVIMNYSPYSQFIEIEFIESECCGCDMIDLKSFLANYLIQHAAAAYTAAKNNIF